MERIQCKGFGLKAFNYSCANLDPKSLDLIQCREAEKGSLLNLSAYLLALTSTLLMRQH